MFRIIMSPADRCWSKNWNEANKQYEQARRTNINSEESLGYKMNLKNFENSSSVKLISGVFLLISLSKRKTTQGQEQSKQPDAVFYDFL